MGQRMSHESCGACDFDGSLFDARQLLAAIRSLGPAWSTLLRTAGDHLRVRPAPETWSAIEYAAHSRDITALHVFGVEQTMSRFLLKFSGGHSVFRLLPDRTLRV